MINLYTKNFFLVQNRIIDIDSNDFISFWYQRHEDDKFIVEKIHIFEFIVRLFRYIPEPQFKTIRYYGFYSSHKHVFYEKCKKKIESFKIPFLKSMNEWRNLILLSFKIDPLVCPKCNTVMNYESGFFKIEYLEYEN